MIALRCKLQMSSFALSLFVYRPHFWVILHVAEKVIHWIVAASDEEVDQVRNSNHLSSDPRKDIQFYEKYYKNDSHSIEKEIYKSNAAVSFWWLLLETFNPRTTLLLYIPIIHDPSCLFLLILIDTLIERYIELILKGRSHVIVVTSIICHMWVGYYFSLDERLVVVSFLEVEGGSCGRGSVVGTECGGERGFGEAVVLLVHGRKTNNKRFIRFALWLKLWKGAKKKREKRKIGSYGELRMGWFFMERILGFFMSIEKLFKLKR